MLYSLIVEIPFAQEVRHLLIRMNKWRRSVHCSEIGRDYGIYHFRSFLASTGFAVATKPMTFDVLSIGCHPFDLSCFRPQVPGRITDDSAARRSEKPHRTLFGQRQREPIAGDAHFDWGATWQNADADPDYLSVPVEREQVQFRWSAQLLGGCWRTRIAERIPAEIALGQMHDQRAGLGIGRVRHPLDDPEGDPSPADWAAEFNAARVCDEDRVAHGATDRPDNEDQQHRSSKDQKP
jgi:hypothetical protein